MHLSGAQLERGGAQRLRRAEGLGGVRDAQRHGGLASTSLVGAGGAFRRGVKQQRLSSSGGSDLTAWAITRIRSPIPPYTNSKLDSNHAFGALSIRAVGRHRSRGYDGPNLVPDIRRYVLIRADGPTHASPAKGRGRRRATDPAAASAPQSGVARAGSPGGCRPAAGGGLRGLHASGGEQARRRF